MPVGLNAHEAAAKIAQINDALQRAKTKSDQLEQTQQDMVGSNWHGGAATTYATVSDTQKTDLAQILSQINRLAEEGKAHIQSLIVADPS